MRIAQWQHDHKLFSNTSSHLGTNILIVKIRSQSSCGVSVHHQSGSSPPPQHSYQFAKMDFMEEFQRKKSAFTDFLADTFIRGAKSEAVLGADPMKHVPFVTSVLSNLLGGLVYTYGVI